MRIALPVVTSVGVSADNVLLAMAYIVRSPFKARRRGALRTFWYMSLN